MQDATPHTPLVPVEQSIATWLRDDVLNPPPPLRRQKLAKPVGITFGALTSAWTVPLSEQLGEIVSEWFGAETKTSQQMGGYFFAAVALSATLMLFIRLATMTFSHYAKPNPQHEQTITNPPHYLTTLGKLSVRTLATVTAIPATYLAHEEFKEYVGFWASLILLAAPAFLVYAFRNAWAIDNLREVSYHGLQYRLFKRAEQNSIKQKKYQLIRYADIALKHVKSLSTEEAAAAHSALKAKDSPTIADILSINGRFLKSTRPNKPQTNYDLLGDIIKVLGAAVGGFSAYSFYPLTHKGVEDAGIGNTLATITGALSLAFTAALYLYAVQDKFVKTYGKLSQCCARTTKRTKAPTDWRAIAKEATITSVSLAGSGPLTMMTYDNVKLDAWYTWPLITAAFTGAFLLKIWAINGLIDWFKPKTPKTKLTTAVTVVRDTVYSMRDKVVTEAANSITSAAPDGAANGV